MYCYKNMKTKNNKIWEVEKRNGEGRDNFDAPIELLHEIVIRSVQLT